LAAPAAAADASQAAPAHPEQRLRPLVLVVDDDAATRILLTRAFARENIDVAPASNGEEGLALARSLKPDVITLDALMPGLSGWDTLRALKRDPALGKVTVVMLTIADEKALALALGAADCMRKGAELKHIVRTVRQFVVAPPAAPPALPYLRTNHT
jgi:CheY-like chemotaxis protein